MKRLALFVVASAISAQVHAADRCEALMAAYEHASKAASAEEVAAASETNVPRAAVAEQRVNNWLLVKQMNLQLMIQWKCPAPTDPVVTADYFSSALSCAAARARGMPSAPTEKGNQQPPECNMVAWTKAPPAK